MPLTGEDQVTDETVEDIVTDNNPNSEQTISAQLAEALKGESEADEEGAIQEDGEGVEPAPETEAREAAAGEEEIVIDEHGRARRKDGKFAKTKAEKEAEEQLADSQEQTATDQTIEAPAHWPAQARKMFDGVKDPTARKMIVDVYGKSEQVVAEQQREIQRLESTISPLEQVLQPHMERIQLSGQSPVQAISSLLAAQAYLDKNPIEGIAWLAKSYGVDLGQLNGQQQYDPLQDEANLSPAEIMMKRKMEALEQQNQQLAQNLNQATGQLNQFGQHLQSKEHMAAQYQEQQLVDQIRAFEAQTDEAGNPAYPHFNNVRREMIALLEGGQAEDLKTAYDMAVWAAPQTRNALLSQQLQAEEQKRAKAARERAQKAKAAGSSISGDSSPGAVIPTNTTPSGSIEEQLRANFNALNG